MPTADLEVLTHIKDEPLALIVAIIIILYKPGEALIRLAVQWITKKKKKSVEEILQEDAQNRKTRQEEYDKRFEKIEAKLESLVVIVADYEEFANSISQGTLENMVFNEGLAPFRRLKAFKRLIAARGNGRAKKKGMDIILHNKETWLDVLDVKMPLKIVDQKYYDDVLNEIERRIMSG